MNSIVKMMNLQKPVANKYSKCISPNTIYGGIAKYSACQVNASSLNDFNIYWTIAGLLFCMFVCQISSLLINSSCFVVPIARLIVS